MFTNKDLSYIDKNYFNIIMAGCFCVTLQSKNTKHYWHIIHYSYPSFQTCTIEHKHNYGDAFHAHGNRPTLKSAIESIMEHDYYHMNVRGRKHLFRLFDKVLIRF